MSLAPPDPIAAAARSLDPAIRTLAARRMEIAAEIARIDTLFASREQVRAVARPRIEPVKMMRKAEFVVNVARILAVHGRPMRPKELYVKFDELHTGYLADANALRKRLHGTKDAFYSVGGRGYWPVGLPETDVC